MNCPAMIGIPIDEVQSEVIPLMVTVHVSAEGREFSINADLSRIMVGNQCIGNSQ